MRIPRKNIIAVEDESKEGGHFEDGMVEITKTHVEITYEDFLIVKMDHHEFMFIASLIRAQLNGNRKTKSKGKKA